MPPPAAVQGEPTAPAPEITQAIEPVREFPLPAAPVPLARSIPPAEAQTEMTGSGADDPAGSNVEEGPDAVRELTLDMLNDTTTGSAHTTPPDRPFRDPAG